jgi:predicted TIM-barrel fold metal-dependent hydrolase
MRGLYYANRALVMGDYRRMFDHPDFDPFWEEVRGLGVPVFWEVVGIPEPAELVPEIERLNRWAERWPDIPGVWTHGFPPELLSSMPEPLEELLRREQMMVEILYPIHWARTHEYPFPELSEPLQKLYQAVGGERLVWGSDMPNVERNCTYRQSLEYLRSSTRPWLPSAQLDLILGGNVLRLLRM